jgi:hypothetical protein
VIGAGREGDFEGLDAFLQGLDEDCGAGVSGCVDVELDLGLEIDGKEMYWQILHEA